MPVALVLGAAGFIGRHVAREMARRGFAVHGVGHGDWTEGEWTRWGLTRWVRADIGIDSLIEAAGAARPAALLHCAGSGAVSKSYTAPFEDFHRSVSSTAALLEFVRDRCNAEPRVVVASSAAVYGDQGDVDMSETAARLPVSPYGFNRVAVEDLCSSYSRFFGLRVSVVRLFSVYGEGLRKQLLWDAMNKFSRGDDQFFGTGHELRDWIHVDDSARLLCLAATTPQGPHEIYNGAHTQATTREVLGRLAQDAGLEIRPRFNGEAHAGNPTRLTADCARAHTQLRWSARVGLDAGLARYAEWFKRQPAS